MLRASQEENKFRLKHQKQLKAGGELFRQTEGSTCKGPVTRKGWKHVTDGSECP